MKKIFGFLLAVFCAATAAAGNLRIDIYGLPRNVQPQELSERATTRGIERNGGLMRNIIFPATGEWKEFKFSLTSPTACKITLGLRSTDDNFVAIDDISVENTKIGNPDFEQISARTGGVAVWKTPRTTLETKTVKSGGYALRVAYRITAGQAGIEIPANKKVVIKGFYRQLDSNAASAVKAAAAQQAAAASLRIDIYGLPRSVQPQELSSRGTTRGIERKKILMRNLLFPATGEWQEFSFALTSPTECRISMNLRSNNSNFVAVDDITAENTKIVNGNFEKINPKTGGLASWKGSNTTLETNIVKTGNYALKVAYKVGVGQSGIKIPANKKVVIKGFYRLQNPDAKPVKKAAEKKYKLVRPKHLPADANVTFAAPYDGERYMLVSTGRLEFRPTFENCGVYLNLLPEERKQKIKVNYFYRKKGEKAFRRALDPAEVIQEHAWRGSLLLLTENTDYEFKAVITGEKGYKKEVTGAFRTMNSNVPYETVVLPAGPMKTAIKSGTPEKYIRYTSNGKIVKAPKKDAIAVFDLTKVKYAIFDNIEVDAKGAQHAFYVTDASDIIIRNCDIYNFGREPGKPRYNANGYYSGGMYTKNGILMYDDCAFSLTRAKNILIERNYAHDPVFSAQTWLFAHPSGPGGVKAKESSNCVVRYNDFIGRNGARFIDHVISPPNGSFYGGIYRDGDYYGNSFLFSDDDGAEIEAGAMNTRCYGNRIEQVLSGISTGPITLGPTYLFGNLYTNPGDTDGTPGQPYKNGGGKDGYNWTRGMLFMMHNSVGDSWTTGYGVGMFSIPHKDWTPTLKAYLRNNIIRTSGKFFHRRWPFMKTDCDGDLLERTHIEPSLVTMDEENIRVNKLEPNGIYAKADYVSAATGNYGLKVGSPGYKKVHNVPNLEHYPQAGAYLGTPGEWFPKRPLDLMIDTTELHWLKGDNTPRSVTITAGKTMQGKFKVHCNDKFFTVKPAAGTFAPGKKITFTIQLKPEAMKIPRRYTGAFLVRSESGLGLPVTLFADRRTSPAAVLAQKDKFFTADELKKVNASALDVKVTVPADGTYFMIMHAAMHPNVKVGGMEMTFDNHKLPNCKPFAIGPNDPEYRLLKSSRRRLVPFELKKGTHTIHLSKIAGLDIKQVYLTQAPSEIMANRSFTVKTGK